MRVASSRLDIVNETDTLVQKTQQQADHFRKLKKKAMSLPVIGSIVGTVGGILLIRMFTGKKSHPAPPRPHVSGSWINSPIFRFIIEILVTLAFPSLKKWASTWQARNSSTCSSNRIFRSMRRSLFKPLL
jgi:hypothetical protein